MRGLNFDVFLLKKSVSLIQHHSNSWRAEEMIRNLIVVLILAFGIISLSSAQVSTSGLSNAKSMNESVFGLGGAVGWNSGIGISFRAHLPSKTSFQGVFGIINASGKLSMTVGTEYQYDLVRGNTTRFYAAAGVGYFYSGTSSNELSAPVRIGGGLGGEFNIRESIHVSVGGMFVFFSDGDVLPLPQIAAHYYFN